MRLVCPDLELGFTARPGICLILWDDYLQAFKGV
jgi:hypothetical protein